MNVDVLYSEGMPSGCHSKTNVFVFNTLLLTETRKLQTSEIFSRTLVSRVDFE